MKVRVNDEPGGTVMFNVKVDKKNPMYVQTSLGTSHFDPDERIYDLNPIMLTAEEARALARALLAKAGELTAAARSL